MLRGFKSRLIILLFLALCGCAIPIHTKNPLHIAAERGDVEAVRNWIAAGPHSGDALERLRFLLSAGVRFPKNTLLGCASMPEPQATQSLAVAELLLAQGADPNIASAGPWSATPLMLAAGKHNPEMVRLLLNSGANPKLPSETGRTALMSAVGACYSGSASTSGRQRQRLVVELLFAAGANISARDRRGTTAAALADECCKRQVADEDQRRICRLLTGQERASPDSGVYPARASRRGPMTFSA